ncbi:MAG: lytic transglycosylase domain-containing protein [Janthinobacterium lividum]
MPMDSSLFRFSTRLATSRPRSLVTWVGMAALPALLLAPAKARACWDEAGAYYGVNVHLLYAIAKTESGLNPRAINRNKNGSYDIGLMQINSAWLPMLRKHGVDEKQLYDACTSIQVGAWIMAQNMKRLGETWNAVGAYNAKSPELRVKYALKVYKNLPREPQVLREGNELALLTP